MRETAKPNAKEISAEKLAELKHNASMILAETRMQFIRQYPFLGNISLSFDLTPVRDPRCPTAATDGSKIYFDIDFLSRLSPNDRMFIFGHEVYHNVMMHFIRCEARDKQIWNVATDIEVNEMLKADGLQVPKDACTVESMLQRRFNEPLAAEEYYDMLVKKQKLDNAINRNSSSSDSGNSEANSGSGDGADDQPIQSGNQNGIPSGQFDIHVYDSDDFDKAARQEGMADKYGKISGDDPDFQPNVKQNAVEKIREAAISAAQQIERQRGELPGHLKRLVDKLLEPEVNWREVLAQHVTRCMSNDPTWNRPNRRFAYHGTYLPGHEGKMLNIAIGLDTSGSTTNEIIDFLSEVNGIISSYGNYSLDIIQCDTQIQKVEHFDNDQPLDFNAEQFEIRGGGGTRLMPVFDEIDLNGNQPDVCVMFTDGYCEEMPESRAPQYPVLWVLRGRDTTSKNFHFGEVVNFK